MYTFSSSKNLPTFHSEEMLVNLVRRRECFVCPCTLYSTYTIQYTLLLVYVVLAGAIFEYQHREHRQNMIHHFPLGF